MSTKQTTRTGVLLLGLALATMPAAGQAQETTEVIRLDYEWADDLAGPWTKPPDSHSHVMPDGSIYVLPDDGPKFFRLDIETVLIDQIERPEVPVVDLRRDTVDLATEHLRWVALTLDGNNSETGEEQEAESGAWANAKLAPVALKIYDPSCDNGDTPAYIEFKVVPGDEPTAEPIGFLRGTGQSKPRDLGYILVSLHEGDSPVPSFSQEGTTPCEDLLRCVAPQAGIKIMRYGPVFTAVENADGELLANVGTDPFRLPDNLFDFDRTHGGEFDSETADGPPEEGYGGPDASPSPYTSYTEFKADYCHNPVYQKLRLRKKAAVAPEWTLVRGGTLPEQPVLELRPGERVRILEGHVVTRYFLDDDVERDGELVRIDGDSTGGQGMQLQAEQEGAAQLTVETADGSMHKIHIKIHLIPPGPGGEPEPGFTPGWQEAKVWVVGDGYSEQPRYSQDLFDNRWCPKVGCGPVAWAMLCAWWDRENVPAMFYSSIPGDLTISDAPFNMTSNSSKIRAVYNQLHDYCDVICWGGIDENGPNPQSSKGATWPADMVEGGPAYLWIPAQFGFLGYKYVWSWDLTDPDWNQPSSRIRYANKSNRPAIIGLGWLWHYGVSYAYKEQAYKLTADGPALFKRRYFKVNEGWGKDKGTWYSGGDTFLGAYLKPWQK